MRRVLPPSLVLPGHIDFERLDRLRQEIIQRLGGASRLAAEVSSMLRDSIDDVMQTAKTGRRSYAELEKTEKTYVGTRVEIELRSRLGVPRRKLDLLLLGEDVDVKHTLGLNWMIPSEALGHVCILISSDEKRALCSMGLFAVRPEYLNSGANRDQKKSLSGFGFQNVMWLINQAPLTPNFWRTISQADVEAIAAKTSGNDRMRELFRRVQDRPISRRVVEDTASQLDPTRRVRSDANSKRGGTRDELAREGILLMSAQANKELILKLGLPKLSKGEYISHRVTTVEEAAIARAAGFDVPRHTGDAEGSWSTAETACHATPAGRLPEGHYPFADKLLPLSEMAMREAPPELEQLLRDAAEKNGVPIIRDQPVEISCEAPGFPTAKFLVFWPTAETRLNILAPKDSVSGRA